MSSYSEFHVEFNRHNPTNRNEPQQVEIFSPVDLEKNVNKSIAEFSSVFAQSALQFTYLVQSMKHFYAVAVLSLAALAVLGRQLLH